ncbi:uncharacterized protein UTRI_04350_B [Ustilago trichophora]|uniref:Uncharacterized protein n=1 Tax=Ustilago trichophora TaxID=86804 RepID=A0A5C3ED88_9BASI|nr:uncharacterized protein UTRI_04350_B [Ustilago trichophora]
MPEPGRTCACTPRSLLLPAGGVKTLDPSQRVSAQELAAKDKEWQRQRQASNARAEHAQTPPSRPPSYVSTASQVGQNIKAKKKGSPFSLFSRRSDNEAGKT